MSALAISGYPERFSPGQIRSEVGGPIYINSPPGPPTSERIWPGEISTEGPEIARALGKWPKFFKNHRDQNPRKFSRGLSERSSRHVPSWMQLPMPPSFVHSRAAEIFYWSIDVDSTKNCACIQRVQLDFWLTCNKTRSEIGITSIYRCCSVLSSSPPKQKNFCAT